jgi:CubicO group peptidase (beta-lactamase class C family)
LPDSHDLPNYDSLLTRHQTPKSLVDFIRNARPYAAPGTPNNGDREEHSGQNVLALIIERRTGLKFKQAMQKEVFDPLGMRDSGIDDDTPISATLAIGNQGSGPFGLKAAPTIHWSALPGNGSAYTTVGDEWKWLHSLVHGTFLSAASRKAMLGTSEGYGWERYTSKRVNETVYTAGGRAPGFSCFFEYLPSDDTLILALTNLENAANPIIIANAAALLRGKPYQGFHYTYVAPAVAGFPHGNFTFGKDFYRPSATLRLVSNASGVTLNWPGGPMSALLPLSKDHFWDRYYWSPVAVIRDSSGKLAALQYDKFKGTIASAPLR